jgi:parallel beta-helix repeat protein
VAADGSDRSSGLSPADPWKTVSKVNATFFEAGDRIYFRRGDTWREQLTISSSGRQDQPVVLAAYGQGAKPRFAGTVPTLPFRNAVRNAGFEVFTGIVDDGLTDDFPHFFHGGGRVEAVSDTPADGGDVALRLASDGSGAGVYAIVFLPANARVQMRWQAKSIHRDGAVTIRHWLKDPGAVFLQDDLRSWSTQPNWDAVAIAGSADGVWRPQSIEFTTDDAAGAYQVDFSSAGAAGLSAATWIDSIELIIRWESDEDHLFRLGTGYKPKRILVRIGEKWLPALSGEDFNRRLDTLEDLMWLYDPAGGVLFFRDDSDRILDADTSVEISVPETDDEGECGIYIDQANITVADLSVVGWPDDNPAFDDAGGIAVTANADRVTVAGCEVAFNHRVGLMSRAANGTFTGNLFVYNGGNGLAFARPARRNTVAHNQAGYNGYWGKSSDDGEGISLGEGTADNLLEFNEIHHNNRHPLSQNPGGLVLYHSNRNTVRYNRVHSNYKAGVVIDGAENLFYYNLVYENGIGYADTDAPVMCNVMVRNYSPDGPGKNGVYNNIFFAGSSDTRWMANLFINRDCTDTEIRNNVFWGFTNNGHNNVQIRVDGNLQLSGLQLSNNVIGPEGPGFIHFDGSDYATLKEYRAATGQGAGSLSDQPDFLDPNAADFRPLDVSALIDAGRYVGLVKDFDFNPVDKFPDIGAFEYQPF